MFADRLTDMPVPIWSDLDVPSSVPIIDEKMMADAEDTTRRMITTHNSDGGLGHKCASIVERMREPKGGFEQHDNNSRCKSCSA